MPVNSVNRVPYPIDPSSESNDEERRRERQREDPSSKKRRPFADNLSSHAKDSDDKQENLSASPQIPSQIIDTAKVVELMRHKPHEVVTARLLAKKLAPSKENSSSHKRRVNKTY